MSKEACPRFTRAGRTALLHWLVLLHFAAGGLACGIAGAQTPEVARYRRILVPEEALESQIRGLLPMNREDFERRTSELTRPAEQTAGPAAARVESAKFIARLNGSQLEGTAELTIVSASDQPALVTLAPCNVAIRSPAWHDSPRGPAVLGNDSQGVLRCLASGSGVLRWNWSARAEKQQREPSEFTLHLPAAPRRVLEIEAPSDLELSIDNGLCTSTAASEPGLRRWTAELNGADQLRLTARLADEAAAETTPLIVRETSEYTVLPSCLELAAAIALDLPRRQISRLELNLEAGLTATSIELDGQPLAFTARELPGLTASVVGIELPQGVTGFHHSLRVNATADWTQTGPWNLPRLAVAGSVLQEGQITISSPAWLKLQARPAGGCQLTSLTAAAAGRPNDEFRFQLYRASAEIELTADPSPPALREESGVHFSVEGNQVKGVLIADLSTMQGERFAIEALVSKQWIVDAVEASPPEALADRSLSPSGAGQQLLRLNLARPVNPVRHLQLIIRAHTRRPPNGRPLPNEFFRLASFSDVREFRRLMHVQIDEPGSEFTLAREDGFIQRDAKDLTASDLELFESPPSGLVVEINAAERSMRGTLTLATAKYRGDVLVTARAAETGLRQTVSIRCQPDSSAVNSLLVRLAPRPPGEVVWRIEGGQPGDLAATLLGSEPASAPGITGNGQKIITDDLSREPEAALYRLTLPRARSAPFELVGQWSASPDSQGRVSLAWLPEASIQTGIVEFHVTGDNQFVLSADEVEALPTVRPSRDQSASLRARYRYDASQRARIRIQPAVTAAVQRGAWIEQLHLTSYFTEDGRSEHDAELAIRNAGLARFSIRFQVPVREPRLVDRQGLETPLVQSAAGDLSVPLDSNLDLANLRVRYSTVEDSPPSRFYAKLVAPIPEPDLPVLLRRWSVGLPPRWSTLDPPVFSGPARPLDAGEERTAWSSLVNAIRGPAWGWKRLMPGPQAVLAPGESSFAGWSLVQRELPVAPVATILVYQPRIAMLGALGAALAVAAAAPWLAARAVWLLPGGGLLAATALLAPPPVALLCAGILGGLALGSALAFYRQRPPIANRSLSDLLTHTKLHPGAAAILLVASAGSIAAVQSPRGALAAQDDRVPRVVIPVDADRQPIGDYVYVEPILYEMVHRQETTGPRELPDWLLEQVRYELPGAVQSAGQAAAIDRFAVACELHTFSAGVTFRLPFRREQILLLESAARLDGQPAATAWRADGAALEITIPTPGKHRLELSLGAIARRAARDVLLELDVPQAAESRVALSPGGAHIVSCPDFLSMDGQTNQAARAHGSSLSIRWSLPEQANSIGAKVHADQYLWWKVRPGSVVLEAKFRLQPSGGPIQHVAIAADRRLRLLPAASSGGRVMIEEGPQHVVHIELPEPQEGPIPLRLSWLWPDVAGLGELRFPVVQIQADRLDSQWQAISVSSGMEASTFPKLPAVSAAEFLEAWGEADIAAPLAAFDVSAAPWDVPVVVRPEDRPPTAEHAIDWSLNGSSATAHLNIRLSDVPESRFDYRLPLPPQLKAASVRLMQGGRPTTIRWLQQADGLLCLQLLEPPAAEQELSVVAELPLPRMRSRVPLAAPRLRDVALESSTMRIFRQADVGLRLESPAGWTPLDDSQAGQQEAERGRLVASLRNEAAIGDTQPIVARISNRPVVKGFVFIRAHEADGDWRGEVDLALDVTGGVKDELQLVIPDAWAGPLEFDPPVAHRIEELPGPRKQLTIIPSQAISGTYAVSIRGSLHSGEAGLAAPDVALVNMPAVERIVLLDRGQGGQRIVWETAGLMPANPSHVPIPATWRSANGDLLRVVGPSFDATARLHQETTAAPVVRLADIWFSIASGGRMTGAGRYTIRPAGAHGINLVLPPDCRLVQALVDGVATTATRQGPRNWELPTPSSALPFELVLVFDGTLGRAAYSSDELHLAAPRLPGMRVEQTIWRITTTQQPARLAAGEDVVEACSPREAAVRRVEAGARGLDDVASVQGADVLAPILAEAAVHWNGIYAGYSQQLANLEPAAEEVASSVSHREKAAEALAARARQRLAVVNVPAVHDGTSDRLFAAKDSVTPLVLAAANEISQLTLNTVSVAGNRSFVNKLWAALAICLAGAAVPLARWPRAQQWLAAHAHLALALAGLAWWLVAPVGWLGWLAVFAAVWLSVRFS